MTVHVRNWNPAVQNIADEEFFAKLLLVQVGDVVIMRETDDDWVPNHDSEYSYYLYRNSDGVQYLSRGYDYDYDLDDHDWDPNLDAPRHGRMHDHCYRTTRSVLHEDLSLTGRGHCPIRRQFAKKAAARAERRQGKRLAQEAY